MLICILFSLCVNPCHAHVVRAALKGQQTIATRQKLNRKLPAVGAGYNRMAPALCISTSMSVCPCVSSRSQESTPTRTVNNKKKKEVEYKTLQALANLRAYIQAAVHYQVELYPVPVLEILCISIFRE